MIKRVYNIGIVSLIVCSLLMTCNHKNTDTPTSVTNQDSLQLTTCIKMILAKDDALGKIRNHACETISMAETIRNYSDRLKQLNFSNCPGNFKQAFEKHWLAWDAMIPVVEKYPDLRGEMHDLFDQVKAGKDSVNFKVRLKAIWDTWALVEETSQ